MNKGDTAVLSARVHKEKQTDVIWKNNGERRLVGTERPMMLTPQDLHPWPSICLLYYSDAPAILLANL